MLTVDRIKDSTKNPTLMECPTRYFGLSRQRERYAMQSDQEQNLRVLLQVCERCNEGGTVCDGELEACSRGSCVMRREVVCKPIVLSDLR